MKGEPAHRVAKGPRWWLGAFIFGGVLVLRLWSLSEYLAAPAAPPSGGDIAFYSQWAERILAGAWSDGRAFYALPLYAYWLAVFYGIFGVGAFFPAFVQCAADAGTAVLLYGLTLRLLGRGPQTGELTAAGTGSTPWAILDKRAVAGGVTAALAWAFFLPAQAFSIVLMPTALGVFIFWFVVWQILGRDEAPGRIRCLFGGFLLGFAAMAVATILFILPLVAAALLFRWRRVGVAVWPRVARDLALLTVGVILGTAPCWVHNYFVAKDPVFLSAHSGINFWIGNNPEATGYPHFGALRAGQAEMLSDSVALAEKATGRKLRRGEVSAYWSAEAKEYIASDFRGWLQLLGRKIWNFWNAFQYDDLSIVAKLREAGIIFPGIRFGLIAALALTAIPFALRRWRDSRWILAAVGLQMAAILPVFITERYRMAAVPGLVILAVLGVWQFWENCACRRVQHAAIYLVLLIAAAGMVSWSPAEPARWALDPYNAGREALAANDLATAERKLALAFAYVPGNPEINLALGNLWLAKGERMKARAFYGQTLTVQPDHKSALNNLGVLALEDGDYATARALVERSLAADPASAKSHYLLAKILLGQGELEGARVAVDRALSLGPQQLEFQALREQIQAASPLPSDR